MVDSMNRRELLRLSVIWPLAIKTESGFEKGKRGILQGKASFFIARRGSVKELVIP